MASDTDTRNPDRIGALLRRSLAELRALVTSRIFRRIFLLHMLALVWLVAGIFLIAENRRGLVQAKMDSLSAQAGLIANLLVETAVEAAPEPRLDREAAREVLRRLSRIYVPEETRALIYDHEAQLIADSRLIAGAVGVEELPPPGEAGLGEAAGGLVQAMWSGIQNVARDESEREALRRSALDEARLAMQEGRAVRGVRRGPSGELIVSVTLPIQPIQAVVGAVTFESFDLDALIAAERRAILPYIGFAALVTFLSALGLTVYIAWPIRRLADKAREVRLAGGRRVPIPRLANRKDEIGHLGRAFADMTTALYDRLDAIESFAADVSHEIKNPLTSIRSAAEVLPKAPDAERRDKLIRVIQHDVKRLDRLVTDISNASRLDAELARDDLALIDLDRFLRDLIRGYDPERTGARGVRVRVEGEPSPVLVHAHEGPIGRVFLNLVDNAITFSPEGGEVRVRIERAPLGRGTAATRPPVRVSVEDEGPGIPPDNLETIFQRFYTQRPQGSAFGSHSGLGLSICRQIVDAHGGRIWAENRRGRGGGVAGARFVVELPRAGR
ncbi:HAMP domain-containing protein [Marinicauda algicola]|uniref:histidine kinase n=1 Tax=Marinicauda algicola TaxID=2029849 RepID=A0A4S2H122_9PROT|nr:stimulus-sensing domain-containing protein [Marinicauda algicola]TGY89215.1 HAMP domain-containing protein [Marinicauda algicola]